MKLCASYSHLSAKQCLQLDEIRFSIHTLHQGLEFAENNRDKKIILEILNFENSKISAQQIYNLLDENDNLYVDFYDIDDFIKIVDDKHQRWMYHYPITSYNMLYFFLHYFISDITLGEPLTFDLITVNNIINQLGYNINIRVNPAQGRPSLFNMIKKDDNGFKHFWLLPQHMQIYEPYINVLDLYAEEPERERTLIHLFQKGSYDQELQYYCKNCESRVPANAISNELISKRLKCKQQCMQGIKTSPCHFCDLETALIERLRNQIKQEHIDKYMQEKPID